MDEKTLWARIQQSDDQALKELFDLHYKPLCSYAVQFTKGMPEAEDIVQSVFISLWTKRGELNINTSLKAYLYRSVHNAYMDRFRKNKRKDEFIEALKYDAFTNQIAEEDDYILEEKIEKVKKLVETLPSRCKEILLLSKREGYKHREIAEKLNISVKTVESQLRIAFQKIREGFEEDDKFLFFVLFRALGGL